MMARPINSLGLAEALARRVRLKRCRRGCRDEQVLVSLIYRLRASGGHLRT